MDYGLVHVYYGDGAGKTSALVGRAIRAASVMDVSFVQFMKSGDSSEVQLLKEHPRITYYCPGPYEFQHNGHNPSEDQKIHTGKAMAFAWQARTSSKEVLMLDEVLNALCFGNINLSELMDLIKANPMQELYLSGLCCPQEIIEVADQADKIVSVKHPYVARGLEARLGIDK